MRECLTRKHAPFGMANEPIKCLHRHPLGFVIDRLNTSASLLKVHFMFKVWGIAGTDVLTLYNL